MTDDLKVGDTIRLSGDDYAWLGQCDRRGETRVVTGFDESGDPLFMLTKDYETWGSLEGEHHGRFVRKVVVAAPEQMMFDASLVEEAARALYLSYVDEGGIDGLDSSTYPWEARTPKVRERFYREAHAALRVFRRHSRDAELAWDAAISESYACGWLNDWERDDMTARNPYRLGGTDGS